ncbi:MAG: ABC-type transport auxiliary lipoprotein family protein, partial [Pseudomonadota bacterium]
GSEWVDRVPVLFQRALVRTFENSGAITNVGDFTVLPVSDYVLRTDIRAFHADLAGETPTATIEIFARLIADDGKILTAQRFVARETARLDTPESLMPAFDRALNQVLGQITEWTFESAPAAREPGA